MLKSRNFVLKKVQNGGFLFLMVLMPLIILSNAGFASGEVSLELYGGYQTSPHSVVSGEHTINQMPMSLDDISGPFKFTAGWRGKSFSMPPYYGVRFTKWNNDRGWGLDFTHSKAYADTPTMVKSGFRRLEFTDGLNNLTLHRQEKFDEKWVGFTPYVGFGIGVALPHVEVQIYESSALTFEYQYGGPTIAFNSGFKYLLSKKKYLFSEYKFTASWLEVDLTGGGTLKTRIFTNALNVGLGFSF